MEIISSQEGLEWIKNGGMKNHLVITESHKFWKDVYNLDLWTNFTKGEMKSANKKNGRRHDNGHKDSKLFILEVPSFGYLYIKKIINTSKVAKRSTKGGQLDMICPLLRRQQYQPKGSQSSKMDFQWLCLMVAMIV